MPSVDYIPAGATAINAMPGDFILCRRPGPANWAIAAGESLRYGQGHWTHTAYCITPDELIEARWHGVQRNPLRTYATLPYVLVHTEMAPHDVAQANAFALSCVGQRYGFVTDLGIALRFLTPGRGLWFGMNGTEMCSGLVAQALTRGDKIFANNPASLSPTELGLAYGVSR